MNFDWRKLREHRPWLFMLIVLGKKLRTKVGLVLVAACVADGFIWWEPPYDLARPNVWVALGIVLIAAGIAFRIAALGYLKKKEILATVGVYSLCRHPLYLGSILMTLGFCLLLDDWVNYVVAAVYFAIFYTLTIVWEEIRLAERYGEEHRRYVEQTPVILPLGQLRTDGFRLGRALRNGGALLIGLVVFLLAADGVMGRMMNR